MIKRLFAYGGEPYLNRRDFPAVVCRKTDDCALRPYRGGGRRDTILLDDWRKPDGTESF